MKNAEEIFNEFVEEQREGCRMGSGDDMFYEQQVIDYANQQKPFMLALINKTIQVTLDEIKK